MNALLVLDRKSGEPLLDSRVAAQTLGVDPKDFRELLVDHQKALGILRFETAKTGKRGQPEKYLLLTERQALAAITLVRPSGDSVPVKMQLVDAFLSMRDVLTQRKIEKAVHRELTDALLESGEAERTHGHAYSLYVDLIYRATLGMSAKRYRDVNGLMKDANVRENLTPAQSALVEKYEDMVRSMVNASIPYETIKATITSMSERIFIEAPMELAAALEEAKA